MPAKISVTWYIIIYCSVVTGHHYGVATNSSVEHAKHEVCNVTQSIHSIKILKLIIIAISHDL